VREGGVAGGEHGDERGRLASGAGGTEVWTRG